MASTTVCKSVFSIQPFNNKKNISIGFSVDYKIEIVVLLVCELTKQTLKLNQEKWNYLMSETNFILLLSKLFTNSKRTILTENVFYSTNANNESLTLRVDNNRITLSRNNLLRMKQLQPCIDACIFTKQNQLIMYQTCFDFIISSVKQDIENLPNSCQRREFTSSYVQNYEFNLSNIRYEDKYFILELQQFHYEKISDMILEDINTNNVSKPSSP